MKAKTVVIYAAIQQDNDGVPGTSGYYKTQTAAVEAALPGRWDAGRVRSGEISHGEVGVPRPAIEVETAAGVLYFLLEDAVEVYEDTADEERREALRALTPRQRRLLGLPEEE